MKRLDYLEAAGRTLTGATAAAVFFAACMATPALAQAPPTTLQVTTSTDGLLTLTLSATNPSDAVGVNNTYTWTAVNNSPTIALSGVGLGSHWGDWCGLANCTPPGPTLISAPGCASQGVNDIPTDAHFGVWCGSFSGVTLVPGQSVSGSVTFRPGAGGPADYTVYTVYFDPQTGKEDILPITRRAVVSPAATDIQITGSASNGAPPAGSTFTYTYQVKNAGPWGTYGGLIFVDTLPASLAYAGSSVTFISPFTGQPAQVQLCTAVGQTVTCPLFELQASGTINQVTIALTVTASSVAQQVVNTASVATVLPQTDSNPTNNSVTVIVATK